MTHADLPVCWKLKEKTINFPGKKTSLQTALSRLWLLVCELQDKVLGYSLLSIAVGEAHILNISVDLRAETRYSRKMVEHLIEVPEAGQKQFFRSQAHDAAAIALMKT